MLLVKMALRNLTRHSRRVIAIALILALGIIIYLTVDSLMLGLTEMSFNSLIDLETGHLQLVNQDYWSEKEELPVDNLINYDKELGRTIAATSGVDSLASQLKFSAKLNNGVDELSVTGYGILPDQARRVFATPDYIVEGSYLTGTGYQAVLGKELAELMELEVGDYLTLLVKTREGSFNTIEAKIKGLVSTQNPDVNGNFVYLPLNIAQQALGAKGKVSQVVIRLKDINQLPAVQQELQAELSTKNDNLRVYSWRKLAQSVIAMSQAQNIETAIMMGLILMIAAIGIVNTVILSALERTKEIGMLKALGFKKKEIILTFMIEAAGIGIIGGLIGLLLSSGGVYYLVEYGLDLSALIANHNFGMPIWGQLYGVWAPTHFIFIFLAGVFLSTLASIPPAYWAASKDPIEAIYSR
ncbi:ABC transporter permease [Halanaerobaculum tunisiense]